jgi:uncharacterized protein YutD
VPNLNKTSVIQNYNNACCFYGCGTWSLTLREKRDVYVIRGYGAEENVIDEGGGNKRIIVKAE